MKSVIQTIFNMFLGVVATIFAGYIFSHMWQWFIAPKFGVQNISTTTAIGVVITINFLIIGLYLESTWSRLKEKNPKITDQTWGTIRLLTNIAFLYPAALLGAYLYHHFMQ